ncbi:unnamed protein product [Aphanomyces euteiches]
MKEQIEPIVSTQVDELIVKSYENRRLMGQAAASEVAEHMKQLLREKPSIRMIFAAAPSQAEMLEALAEAKDIPWERVTAFHMDDYLGLPQEAPQRFGNFLQRHLFELVKPGRIQLIDTSNGADEECLRYSALLAEAPIDIICLGIGENGHIAFNDPPVASFNEAVLIKPVELDDACRQQQVNDGCFASFDEVPTHALTLTIPMLMSGQKLFCMVPGPLKKHAVHQTLYGPVSTDCPASILRKHPACTLFVDTDSFEPSK